MGYISGHGSTLVFTSMATYLPGYTSIGGFEASRDSLDTSVLATTQVRPKIGGDLFDLGAQSHSMLFDPDTVATGEANSIDDLLFTTTGIVADATITITMPNSGATSFAATGHVTGFALEDLATDSLIAASVTTQWNDWPTIAE